MPTDLKGKVALVTGAGKPGGIGFAIAMKLARCDAHVVIADLGSEGDGTGFVKSGTLGEMTAAAEKVAQAGAGETLAVPVDVTRNESIAEMIARVQTRFDRIDILCNNAGSTFGVPNALHTYDEAAWLKTIDVNLHGVFRVTRAVLPLMQPARGQHRQHGLTGGQNPASFQRRLCRGQGRGRHADQGHGQGTGRKQHPRQRHLPGGHRHRPDPPPLSSWRPKYSTATPAEREALMCQSIPLGRIGSAEEVAELAVFLASGAASYITGQAINVTGGQLMEVVVPSRAPSPKKPSIHTLASLVTRSK